MEHSQEQETKMKDLEERIAALTSQLREREEAQEDEMKSRVSVESRLVEQLDFRKNAEAHMVSTSFSLYIS